jgi:hypothetical protein
MTPTALNSGDCILSPAIMSMDRMVRKRWSMFATQNDVERYCEGNLIFVSEHDDNHSKGPVSPLHVAVVQCFCTVLESAEVRNSAINILKTLIDSSANKSVATYNIVLLCFHYSPLWTWSLGGAVLTPCGLVAYLKRNTFALLLRGKLSI